MGFGFSARVVELVGGVKSSLDASSVNGCADGEVGVKMSVSKLGIGVSGRLFSTVNTRVT